MTIIVKANMNSYYSKESENYELNDTGMSKHA